MKPNIESTSQLLKNHVLVEKITKLQQYSYEHLKKFPKAERYLLSEDIKRGINRSLELIIKIHSYYCADKRRQNLKALYVEIQILENYVQLAYNNRYISSKHLESWLKQLNQINNINVAWLKTYEKPQAQR